MHICGMRAVVMGHNYLLGYMYVIIYIHVPFFLEMEAKTLKIIRTKLLVNVLS